MATLSLWTLWKYLNCNTLNWYPWVSEKSSISKDITFANIVSAPVSNLDFFTSKIGFDRDQWSWHFEFYHSEEVLVAFFKLYYLSTHYFQGVADQHGLCSVLVLECHVKWLFSDGWCLGSLFLLSLEPCNLWHGWPWISCFKVEESVDVLWISLYDRGETWTC